MRRRPAVPLAAALMVLAGSGPAAGQDDGCVILPDRGPGSSGPLKLADVIPLAQGQWFGDVYVLPFEYPETYDRYLPGQVDNVAARQWVARSFLEHNPDAYDFLAVATTFPFDAGWGPSGDPTHGLYWGIRNDTSGIGLPLFDVTQDYGSSRLQGYIDVNDLELVRDPQGVLDAERFQVVLNHELGHRWLAFCRYDAGTGPPSDGLLGVEASHWSHLLDSDASFMYGSRWRDNGDGTFTATEVLERYSELDLYLMGMLGADEVAPFTLLVNPALAPDQYPELGATVGATSTTVAIDQVIAAEGARLPAAAEAPHELRTAMVLLVPPGTQPTAEQLGFLDDARRSWSRSFFARTGGRGVLGVGRSSLPVSSPSSVDLAGAVAWLLAQRSPSGTWSDGTPTRGRDTAAAVDALDRFGGHEGAVVSAVDSVAASAGLAIEAEAWRAELLARHQHPAAGPLLDQLASWVLDEGAWGGGLRHAGDAVTTARVARALAAGGRSTVAADAVAWVTARNNADGGWSWRDGGSSATSPTLEAVAATLAADPGWWGDPAAQSALDWLLARRTQGGLGEPYPDAATTAMFLSTVRGRGVDQAIVDQAVGFLGSRQRTDGSWQGSVYHTAMAVAALAPLVQPDLSVTASELLVEPESPFVDDQLTLVAAVHAANADVPAGIGYRWEVLDSGQNLVAALDGVLPPIPSSLFATVSDTWNLRYNVSAGEHTFRFVVDPLGELAEPDETNNTAELTVVFRDHPSWIDLALAPDEVWASPPSIVAVPQALVVEGTVRNLGYATAGDAVIAVFDADTMALLGSTTVTVPLDGETAFQMPVQLAEARPTRLAVVADPDDLLGDGDPSNNRVDLTLTVTPTFDPALAAGGLRILEPPPIHAGDPLVIEVEAVNRGTLAVTDLQIGLSTLAGDPPAASPLQLLTVDGELEPGASRILSWEWRPPNASPELTLAAEVDPSGLVADANRDNNTAQLLVEVLPSPLPNLAILHSDIGFSPDPALQHETVNLSAIVRNQSDNPAGPFVVRLWIDEVGTGVPVGETAAVGLGPGEALTVEGAWIVDEMADRLVWVDVDADQQVVEFNEADNQAFRVLDVQTIPDLVLTSGQVSFQPSFPHSGDTVHVEAVVANTGDQPAGSFEVALALDDGTLLDTAFVSTIDGGGSATVTFDWTTTGVLGDVGLEITADPADAIVELSESNNLAAIALAVQDADLWVSERFISPDGDGVRDSTVVFVREPSGDVTVTDRDGEVVRILAVDPATGQATWNGRNEGGGVVRDGVYELSSAGLATWVEVDLNRVRITDDIQQPLLVGTVPKTSTAYGSRFVSFTRSPVDGVVYLVEQLSNSIADRKVWRWAGAGLEDVPDWPAGHWDIHQVSADETVFITRPNSWSYELIRMPGGTVEPLPTPAGVDTPNLSPDGEWVVWVKKMPWASQQTVLLQHLDDPSEIHELGPYTTGWSAEWVNTATVHWTSDGRRAVVTMHCPGYPSPFGHALALVIELGTEPSVRERTLDRACATNAPAGIAASVDFDRSRFYCIRDTDRALYEFDLETGTSSRTIDLPSAHNYGDRWFRLSNDGRAVEVDETYPPDGPGKTMPEFFLYDWQRGVTAPWPSANVYFERTWSALDRHVYDPVTQHFTYRTPTANLAVALEPVVRFGGEGIDLVLTAVDRNLDRHWLELAPAADPEAFVPIGQPSREVMLGDTWGTWIPPSAGAWRLRLTAADLAGNRRSASRWVTWNGANDIAGLWLEDRRISPLASPGVRDELVWHYTVLRPAQLLFEILDPSGAVVRRIPVAADEPGAATTSWDGLDAAGRPVPDGDYALDFRGAAWPVAVDNTPPATTFEIGPTRLRPTADEIAASAATPTPVELARSALFNEVSWAVDDAKLERAGFESRRSVDVDWSPLSGPSPFSTVTAPAAARDEVQAGWFADRVLRQTAVDLAGNSSTAERLHLEERLAFAVAEPPCRSDPSPCLFPDRPEVHQLGDADGLMDAEVAVLWPFYSTLLVQGALAGDWRDTLRLEFRVPADGGSPPGDWQPGTLAPAERPVRRRVKVPTGDPVAPWGHLEAPVLPVYWEHPGLPQRPYEVRLVVQGSGGEVASPSTIMVPNSPLAVEYLRTDGGGDHFRVHNIGVATLDGIELQASRDTFGWWAVTAVGSLEAGRSVLVSTGCALYDAAVAGNLAGWVRAVGIDPVGATQASLPAALRRAGPARAVSRPAFTLIRGACEPGSPQAVGMTGYQSTAQGELVECTSWRCDQGWHTPGGLVDLQVAVPDTDPTGTPIVGYELLVDGVTVAGAPELAPGTAGHVILDLGALAEGEHVVSERYLFAPGDDGLLSTCVQSAPLHVDRSAAVTITSPAAGASLCPDQGLSVIEAQIGETPWSVTYLIDGSGAAIAEHPTTREPAISVSALEPGAHTLTAEVVDLAGNPACDAVEFTSDGVAAVTGLTVEPPVFSPVNDLGRPTAATISFGSTATASYVVEIRDGFDDQLAVIDGSVDAGGTVSAAWDGRIFGGPFAPDGSYRVWIRLESDCGATFVTPEPLPTVEVDTSGPVVVIGQPWPGAWVQTGLEIAGLVADPHFESWRAELRPAPPVPGAWQTIASGDRPTGQPDTILARWPVTGLPEGDYELRIEAVDLPGNRTVTPSVPFELHPLQLIARLEAEPIYFSPNGDGAADTTELSFELLEEVVVWLGFEGEVNLISGEILAPGSTHVAAWDGLDDLLQPMPEGAYTFSLDAHRLDMSLFEAEGVTVVVDRTPPSVILASPQPGALLSPPVTVSGTTDDLYPDSYTVGLLRPDGTTVELRGGLGRWDADDGVVLRDLADGAYTLTVTAADLASNHASMEVDFEVDQTAPSVLITAPAAGALLDPAANQLVLRATVAAAHPDSLAWWIAPGADPATGDFALVHSAPLTAGGAVEHPWSGASPADGVHTLRLTVLDQLGRTGEGRVVFAVDSEPPLAQLHSPADGATLLEPVPTLGTIGDANLEHWFLEEVIDGGAGRVLASGTEPADGEIALWEPLPADGPATLRLRAFDEAGHASEASVAVTVSVLPPGAPQGLAAQLEGRDATLSWQPGPGAPPVGYHVERNGLRITSSPVAATVFSDPRLLDGHYRYRVVAVGPAGRESEPSDEAAIVVDLTPPTVALTAPGHGQRVGGEVAIRGTAFAEDDFGHWQVSARAAGGDWLPLASATAPIIAGELTSWLTLVAPWTDGPHELRLAAEDVRGNHAEAVVPVEVDNSPPNPGPVDLAAVLTNLDPDGLLNDVQLSWVQEPVPPDLAGYYLYRDGILANAGGPVVGDPSPFLLHDAAYDDRNLPDGTYTWTVAAADTAGNVSVLSSPAGPITVDVRRPHAVIASPEDGAEIEGAVEVEAECPDHDLSSLVLEVRAASSPDWAPLAPAFTAPPFVAPFSPPELGLYFLRAVASDAGGPDPSPHVIDFVAADLPPAAPAQLTARVAGDEVTLTWVAPPDPGDDLAGFVLVRDGQVITDPPLPTVTLSFVDAPVGDGDHSYRVKAVDQAGQLGASSEPAAVQVLTPHWEWLEPVTAAGAADLAGRGAHPLGAVELRRQTAGQPGEVVAEVVADEEGTFAVDAVQLEPDWSAITAVSSDTEGNTSRVTLPLVLIPHPAPEAPSDLTADVIGSDVELSWAAVADPDGAGFAIARTGVVVNETVTPVPYDAGLHDITASSGEPAEWPAAVDGDPLTGWAPDRLPTMGTPEWWSWQWGVAVEVHEVELEFSPALPPQLVDLDLLTEGGWLWVERLAWAGDPVQTVPAGIVATGVRVRVPVTGACGSTACLPELVELRLSRVDRTTATTFLDPGLPDGAYLYEVSRRNRWSQESTAAQASVVVGSDQTSPPTSLTVTPVDCGGLRLEWVPAASQPGTPAGFRIHRGSDSAGPYEVVAEVGSAITIFDDGLAPVGAARHYRIGSLVDIGGVVVESEPCPSSAGTAVCANPPPPVITAPTVAGQPRLLPPRLVPVTVAGSAFPGSTVILLRDGSPVATTTAPEGLFSIPAVDVPPGWSSFVARQLVYGSVADSLPIELGLDPDALPDLVAESVTVEPGAAVSGDTLVVEATVGLDGSLPGTTQLEAVVVVEDPAGAVTEIRRATISLAAGERATIRSVTTAGDLPGPYRWRLLVDPDDRVLELDEGNNLAGTVGRVLAEGGVELTVTVDEPVYFVGRQLTGEAVLATTDPPANYRLKVRLEDAGGVLVEVLEDRLVTALGWDWTAVAFDHLLVGLYPGVYRIHAVASVDGVVMAEGLAPFQVRQPALVEATVSTDRATYPHGAPVVVTAVVGNVGPSPVIDLTVALSVVDQSTGQPTAESTAGPVALPAGADTEVAWTWSSGQSPPGAYHATAIVTDASGTVLATAASSPFTVVPGDLLLAGTIELSASTVEPGDPITASVGIANNGVVDLPNVDVTVALIDPLIPEIVESHAQTVALPAGGQVSFEQGLGTSGLALQHYVVLVSAAGDDGGGPFDVELAGAALEIADLTPPQVTVLSPPAGGAACDLLSVEARVEDALSRVRRVSYRLDDEPTAAPLHLANPDLDPTLYSASRPLPAGPDGPHEIVLVAEDEAGNIGDGVTASFTGDTAPPELDIEGPVHGACVPGAAIFTISAQDPHLVDVAAWLDGQPYTSGTAIAAEGHHLLEVVAADACGHSSSAARAFIVDSTPPVVVVTGVANGAEVPVGTVLEWSASDANLTSASATLDGQPISSPFTLDLPGAHTLHVAAADCAGTTTEVVVSFTVIEAVLALAGTAAASPSPLEPGDTLTTSGSVSNLGSSLDAVALTLEVVHLPTTTVLASTTETLDLAAGQSHGLTAAFDTTGWPLGEAELRLSARGLFLGDPYELALAASPVALADLTAPELTVIAPSPGLACAAVTVVAEAVDPLTGVAGVWVRIDGDPTLVPLAQGAGSTWSVALALDDGPHHILFEAADGFGNPAEPVAVDIDLDTTPPVLTVTAPDDGSCVAEPAVVEFSATDPHLEDVIALLDDEPIVSGHPVADDGAHHLTVTANDACGLETVDDRQFVLDTVDPELTVTGVADGATYVAGVAGTWTAEDDNLVTAEALLDGAPVDPSFTVPGLGGHLLELSAEDCAGNLAGLEVAFATVAAGDGLAGDLGATPLELEPPQPLVVESAVRNLVDTPYPGLTVRLELTDSTSGAVLDSAELTGDLVVGGLIELDHAFPSDGMGLGGYRLRLEASGTIHGGTYEVELAALEFQVVDLTPPDLSLLAPEPGLACDAVEVRAEATDAVAGVDSVRVHVDGDPAGIPLTPADGDLWVVDLSLTDGAHDLAVIASDAAGNESSPAAVSVDLDLSAPELVVAAPADGTCQATPATIVFTAIDAHLEGLQGRLNGEPVSSGHTASADGDYHLRIRAVDACGLDAVHDSDFVIDATAPSIAVSGVEPGGEHPAPVTVDWVVDEPHLVDARATLDGTPVETGVVVEALGPHLLTVEAVDCAGNQTRTEVAFTLVEGVQPDLEVLPPALSATASVLLVDRAPAGGEALAVWLGDRAGRVVRITDACALLEALRDPRHDLAAFYAPRGAVPFDPGACPDAVVLDDLADELSAASYRRGGILILGEGFEGEGCLGCRLGATGAVFLPDLLDRIEVEAATGILEPDAPLSLFDLRPLEPAGAFPLLLGGGGGDEACEGTRALGLELDVGLPGPWTVTATVATPGEALESETGELDDGGALDRRHHDWVDLGVGRSGARLSLDLREARGGALPDWLFLDVVAAASDPAEHVASSGWLRTDCDLEPGWTVDLLRVTSVERVSRGADQAVASSARRFGRGETVVLPWDVLAPANVDALAVVEQALAFAMPAEPWPAVEGLPLPVTFGVRNPGEAPRSVRIEASVGSDLVLEVWNAPVTTDPLTWELEVQPGATAAATVWLRPPAGTLELPYTVAADDGSGWAPLESGTFTVEVAPFDLRRALRELDAALVECGAGIDDPGALAVLRDLRSAVDRVAATPGGDRAAAASGLRELARAFAAAGDEPLPCLAAARGRIADLVVAWQIRWTAGGEVE